MGFAIGVDDIVMYIARCAEMDCDKKFKPRGSRHKAEKDAEKHYKFHADKWRKQNEEWDRQFNETHTVVDRYPTQEEVTQG